LFRKFTGKKYYSCYNDNFNKFTALLTELMAVSAHYVTTLSTVIVMGKVVSNSKKIDRTIRALSAAKQEDRGGCWEE
jgi:type IV secretory pathway protease TraF